MAEYTGLREKRKHEPLAFTIDFSVFYSEIIQKLYNIQSKDFLMEVRKELKAIRRENFDIGFWHEKQFYGNISFTESAARCAYMYAYSVINTSVAYCEFSKYLKENEGVLQIFSVDTIQICCLGGGAALEAFAICKAINDIVWKTTPEYKNSSVRVDVIVVDICPEWESEAYSIFNTLNTKPELFNFRRVCFKTEFIEADLLKPLSKDVQKVIKNATITTVVRLVNPIQVSTPKDRTPQLKAMLESVSECVSDKSCLFLLDTAGGIIFNYITNALPVSPLLYEKHRNFHKSYRLHPTVLQRLENAIGFRRFPDTPTLFPTHMTKISSCIWIKREVFC